jgi:hypothetical protein
VKGENTIVVLELHNGTADASMQFVAEPVLMSWGPAPAPPTKCDPAAPGQKGSTVRMANESPKLAYVPCLSSAECDSALSLTSAVAASAAHTVSAALPPPPPRSRAAITDTNSSGHTTTSQVRVVFLCAVTFHANHAHNLTRSP